jgi:EamA domain-containing membrane protein RarD
MVAVTSSRCAWLVDHTPDAGGVVVLCGLVHALPLDFVVGTVPRFWTRLIGTVDYASGSLFLCVGVCLFVYTLLQFPLIPRVPLNLSCIRLQSLIDN